MHPRSQPQPQPQETHPESLDSKKDSSQKTQMHANILSISAAGIEVSAQECDDGYLIKITTDAGSKELHFNNEKMQHFSELLDKQENHWLRDIINDPANPLLPREYKFYSKTTLALLFAIASSVAASLLYYDGSAQAGTNYVVGGIGSNDIQSLLFGMGVFNFIYDSIQKREDLLQLTVAVLGGMIATMPSAISSYKLAHSILKLSLTILGNFPGNVFGVYMLINRLFGANQDSSAWQFLLNRLQSTLASKTLLNGKMLRSALPPEYSRFTKATGSVLGLGASAVLVGSLTGYGCAASNWSIDFVGNQNAGIVLGILENVPGAAIAVLMAGMELGKSAAKKVADLYHYLTGEKELQWSSREKTYMAALMFFLVGSGVLANFSAATSVKLFENECPAFESAIRTFLSYIVDYGTRLFNGVLAAATLQQVAKYLLVAYAAAGSPDRAKYLVEAADRYFRSAPVAKVEAIATNLGWKKPEPQPVRASVCARLAIWRHTGDTRYQRLASDAPSPKSSWLCWRNRNKNKPAADANYRQIKDEVSLDSMRRNPVSKV